VRRAHKVHQKAVSSRQTAGRAILGLYNFQERFVKPILSGRKKHTIRAHRKHPDEPGDVMHLYTGLRTKKARLLMRSPCVKVEEITGCVSKFRDRCKHLERADACHFLARVIVDGVPLETDEAERLAHADGFKDFIEMRAFWKGRIPFSGQIIHWK
jgi:hypothetical protein